MKNFDIILWDVDQTLLDFNKSQRYALCYSFEQFGKKISDSIVAAYAAINDSYWKRLERGEITKKELLTGRFADLFREMQITDIDVHEFQPIYQRALGEVYFFQDDSLTLCKKLKGKVKQYIITNGVSATQRNKLRLSGLDQVMDDIFVSEEIGYPKPELAYFEACFAQIPGFDKERALLVGDSLTSDIKGANRAGIRCCWYNPEGKPNTTDLNIDYQIRNLWEVEELL